MSEAKIGQLIVDICSLVDFVFERFDAFITSPLMTFPVRACGMVPIVLPPGGIIQHHCTGGHQYIDHAVQVVGFNMNGTFTCMHGTVHTCMEALYRHICDSRLWLGAVWLYYLP